MIKSKFQKGDCVRIKSGGPKMVYVEEASDGKMACIYYHKNGDIIKIVLAAEALRKARK